jgi:hypothetical protein
MILIPWLLWQEAGNILGWLGEKAKITGKLGKGVSTKSLVNNTQSRKDIDVRVARRKWEGNRCDITDLLLQHRCISIDSGCSLQNVTDATTSLFFCSQITVLVSALLMLSAGQQQHLPRCLHPPLHWHMFASVRLLPPHSIPTFHFTPGMCA